MFNNICDNKYQLNLLEKSVGCKFNIGFQEKIAQTLEGKNCARLRSAMVPSSFLYTELVETMSNTAFFCTAIILDSMIQLKIQNTAQECYL